jgi:ATP dependent DNA ligase domain
MIRIEALQPKDTLVYCVFDLLMLDGKDLRQVPLVKRKQRLARFLAGHPRLLDVEHTEKEGLAMFAGAVALGLEGIVAAELLMEYTALFLEVVDHFLPAREINNSRNEPNVHGSDAKGPFLRARSHQVGQSRRSLPRLMSSLLRCGTEDPGNRSCQRLPPAGFDL